MSRSKRIPIITHTNKIDKRSAHKQVRKRVKMELLKDEPDEYILEADTTELGLDEWGTKYGWYSADITPEDDDWDIKGKKKHSRK